MTIFIKYYKKHFKDIKNQKSTPIILILIRTDLLTLFKLLDERGGKKFKKNYKRDD